MYEYPPWGSSIEIGHPKPYIVRPDAFIYLRVCFGLPMFPLVADMALKGNLQICKLLLKSSIFIFYNISQKGSLSLYPMLYIKAPSLNLTPNSI